MSVIRDNAKNATKQKTTRGKTEPKERPELRVGFKACNMLWEFENLGPTMVKT